MAERLVKNEKFAFKFTLQLSSEACDEPRDNGPSQRGFIVNSDWSIWIWARADNTTLHRRETYILSRVKCPTRAPKDYFLTPVWLAIANHLFIEQANTFHPTIKFTAEISEKEITFLDTVMYKGESFLKKLSPRRQNSLQADRDLSIYTLFLLPPTRR